MTSNEWITVGLSVLGIVSTIISFLIKRLLSNVDKLEIDVQRTAGSVADLRLKIAEDHPSHTDFKEFRFEMNQMLITFLTPINSKLSSIENYLRDVPKRRGDS